MSPPKVMSGARAKLGIHDPTTGQTKIMGIFTNVSYGVTYDVQPAFILGRFSAAEIDYTAVDVVQITASGWRVIGEGRHKQARLPKVSDLLLAEYLEMVVIDRQQEAIGGEPRVTKIRNVRPTSGSEGFTARQLSEITMTYVGLLVDDESTVNEEDPTAANMP